jgi:hypothetical protein
MVKDTRVESINIELLSALKGDVTLYDELGNKQEFKNYDKSDNVLTLKDIELVGGKIAVFEIK